MRQYLIESGFNENEDTNTFTKDSWTIRFYENLLEVYDGIEDGESGVYWIGESTWENLIIIVEEILGVEILEFGQIE